MDYNQLWQRIRYRKGHMLSASGGSPVHLSIVVVRREGDRLLVRCETSPRLAADSPVLLEVWGPDALTRVSGAIEQVLPRADGGAILVVRITATDALQRRSSPRYTTRLPTTFIPVSALDEDGSQIRLDGNAMGQATNIGIGGMQLETDYSMPVGTRLYVNVSAPDGPILVEGRIVNKRTDALGTHVYGIEFTKFDSLTAARLNRVVNRIELDQARRKRTNRYLGTYPTPRRARLRRVPLSRSGR